MKRIILSGYYGFNNAGDEAILLSLIRNLKKRRDDLEIIVLSANPSWTEKSNKVKAINRNNLKEISEAMRSADLLISGGGSLLQDITSSKSLYYYLGIITLAKFFKVPVSFSAQGVGPIIRSINKRLVKSALSKVDLITVRDNESKNLLKEIGVKKEIEVTADLVFALKGVDRERTTKILKDEDIIANKCTKLGISIRPWGDNAYLKDLARLLDIIKRRRDIDIVFIPLHYPSDLGISREVQNLMKEDSLIIEKSYSSEELLSLVGEMDILVGVRLHSLIFAALNRVPLIGISYDPKIDSFLERLGMKAIATIDDFNVDEVMKGIEKIYNRREEIIREIDKKVFNLEGLGVRNIELSLSLVDDIK